MRFLVTGGAGFIGRWVVRRLLERSDAQITVLDNYSNSSPSNLTSSMEMSGSRQSAATSRTRIVCERFGAVGAL